jgi:hypothetical protein
VVKVSEDMIMDKKIDRFDLEQDIMNAWHICDDLQAVLKAWDSLNEDKKMNILIGINDLYNVKFETLFNTFEQCIKNGEFGARSIPSNEQCPF